MRVRNSLRSQLVVTSAVGIAIILVTIIYTLTVTVRLQGIINDQFRAERRFQELQQEVVAIRTPLLNYLSSRSSAALSDLFAQEQRLRSLLPQDVPIQVGGRAIAEREMYALLGSYLDSIQQAIELKRARAIQEYTALYEEMTVLNEHIVERIDRLSLSGLRTELSSFERIIQTSRTLLFWNLAVIVLAFLGSTLWIFLSIQRIVGPMNLLSTMAGEISSGNFDVDDIQVDAVQEVATVIAAFNAMKHDVRKYIDELSRQQQLEQGYMEERLRNLKMSHVLKRMELYTMQAQMNPHFLFNTLNTGVQIAITEDADRTADYMEHLAAFFRYNLRERNLIVPLRREIEGLEEYLYILRIRFPRSMGFSLDVPEDLLDAVNVPSLILQPLVENSVIHAFKGIEREGRISVVVRRDAAAVSLTVRDNGVGIDPVTASRLLERHEREAEEGSKVMGLENVIHRLYFFYPNQNDVVVIRQIDPGGTEITLRIPTEVEPCIPS